MSHYKNKNLPTPKKAKKKFTLSQWIVFILMIFWTVCGSLSIFLTARDCTRSASADTVTTDYVFSGSNFTVTTTGSYGSNFNDTSAIIPNTSATTCAFTFVSGVDLVRVSTEYYNAFARASSTAMTSYENGANVLNTFVYLRASEIQDGTADTILYGLYDYTSPIFTANNINKFFIRYNQDIFGENGINFDVVEFGQEVVSVNGNNCACNFVSYSHYNELNNARITLYFPISSGNSLNANIGFDNRIYYLNPQVFGENSQTAYDSGYDKGYQNGKRQGKEEGLSEGKLIGKEEGYQNGLRDGKQQGYNDGLRDGGDYNFLGLLSSVVDAPVQMLSGLLNFNILGFNMLQFVLGLLTIGLIIFIIRLFL